MFDICSTSALFSPSVISPPLISIPRDYPGFFFLLRLVVVIVVVVVVVFSIVVRYLSSGIGHLARWVFDVSASSLGPLDQIRSLILPRSTVTYVRTTALDGKRF